MADRVLRGSRMGAVSYETDRDHDLAPRQMVRYKTETNEVFEVPFAHDAEIPGEWLCKNGQVGILMEGEGIEAKPSKPARTHWDMLRERRSIEDLDILLEERIEQLRSSRTINLLMKVHYPAGGAPFSISCASSANSESPSPPAGASPAPTPSPAASGAESPTL